MITGLSLFSSTLRDGLIHAKKTPSHVARAISTSEVTATNWINGTAMPVPINAWRLSTLVGRKGPALLASYLNWYWQRSESTSLTIEEAYYRIIGRMDSPNKLTDKELVPYLSAWHDAYEIMSKSAELMAEAAEEAIGKAIEERSVGNQVESLLIQLPTPKIIIIEQWREIANHIAKDSKVLYELGWREFEDLMGGILRTHGWEVQPQGYTKDGGVDLVAVKKIDPGVPINMLVQCKRYKKSRKVGIQVVREIWSVKWKNAFHQAMIATSSSFTKGAREGANEWKMQLTDHEQIVKWCKGVGKIIA